VGNSLTGNLTYDPECPSSVAPSNPSLPAATGTSHYEWPIDFDVSDFPCTNTTNHQNLTDTANTHLWVGNNIASKELKPGVICHTGSGAMTLNENGVTGNVTLVAEYIRISGTGNNLTAYLNGVLLHAYGKDFPSMVITANGGTMNGIIYQRRHDQPHINVPRGQVIINGSNGFVLNGSIISWIMRLEGSNWSIINTLEGTAEPAHLVE
jgi:hypothetical protein